MHIEKEHLVGSKYTHNEYTQKTIYILLFTLCLGMCIVLKYYLEWEK